MLEGCGTRSTRNSKYVVGAMKPRLSNAGVFVVHSVVNHPCAMKNGVFAGYVKSSPQRSIMLIWTSARVAQYRLLVATGFAKLKTLTPVQTTAIPTIRH